MVDVHGHGGPIKPVHFQYVYMDLTVQNKIKWFSSKYDASQPINQ